MSRELMWPPSLRITHVERRLIGNAGVSRSPLSGATTTVDRSGDRWALSVTIENLSDRASYAERAAAEVFLAAIRNRNARVWIEDPGYVQRGSFSAPELFANADFSNGVTGWTTSLALLTVRDRVGRMAVETVGVNPLFYQSSVSVSQYSAYVLRSMLIAGKGLDSVAVGPAVSDAVAQNQNYLTTRGLLSVSRVMLAGTCSAFSAVVAAASGYEVGHYVDVPFTSLARCALVDNGPNALLYSDQITDAVWSKSAATADAVAGIAPDGTPLAQALIENSSTAFHYVTQSSVRASVAEDLCAYGYFKRRTGTRDVALHASSAGSLAGCVFNLGAGTAGSVYLTGTATNGRAFIRDAGDGWYYCAVVARFPATTSLNFELDMINAGSGSYTGDGTSSIYAWRVGAARSGVPTRGAQTVATALPDGATQTGSGLYLKGLPVSTSGLLFAGDSVQIGKQWFKLLAPLDSDAAGLGYLEVSPNIRTPFADNEPVIINRPMGRYVLASDSAGYSTRAGHMSTMTLEFEEALD